MCELSWGFHIVRASFGSPKNFHFVTKGFVLNNIYCRLACGNKFVQRKCWNTKVCIMYYDFCSFKWGVLPKFPFRIFYIILLSIRHTAVVKTLHSFCPVWSKFGIFKMSFWLCKGTATLLPTIYVLANNETFQMRYWMKFYLKVH